MKLVTVLLVFGCLSAAQAGNIRQLTQDGSSTAVESQLGTGAMICYTDTAEFFSQAIAIPNVDSYGESLSCFSYACTAEGTSNGRCQTPLSHGWELTSACKARSDNPAFTDVQCCGGNGCNAPTDTKLWNYVGPADNTAHLSCYFNGLTGLNPNEAYSGRQLLRSNISRTFSSYQMHYRIRPHASWVIPASWQMCNVSA